MIYFTEHDAAGNICHVCCDPLATIVPLINRVTFKDVNGNALKDDNGSLLSPFGQVLQAPAGISQADYNTLITNGIGNYTYDPTTQSITAKTKTS